jgi:hypothetical protein
MPEYPRVLADTERDWMLRELAQWEQDLRPLKQQWDLFWQKWELLAPTDAENPYISQFVAPYPFSHVETIVPRIVGDQDPEIDFEAVEQEEDDPKAALLSAVVNWQLKLMRFPSESRNFVRQGCITGYSVAKVAWVRETEQRTLEVLRKHFDANLMAEFEVKANEDVEWVLRNEGFFETVDVYNFVWPVRATSLNKAPAVWQREWVRLDELRDMEKKGFYKNVDEVRPWTGDDRRTDLAVRFAAQGIQPHTLTDQADAAEVEVWERWEDDRLTVIANRMIVLRDEPNPFQHKRKPFVDFCPVERPFSMHGVGIIKMMYDMNEDLSALKRQRRDAITFTINPMWKATGGIKESDIKLRPGGVWHVPETEDVEPATNPQIDFSASYQEEQNAKNDMQAVTGAFDYLSGVNPGGVQTATGVATVTQEGNKRIAEMVNVFSERAMKRLGWLMSYLVLQYLDNDVAIPLYKYPEASAAWEQLHQEAAPRIAQIGAEDVKTAGMVLPIPIVGTDKQAVDIQSRSDAAQTMQSIAPILATPGVVDPKELTNYILKKMGVDRHDRAKIVPANSQPAPMPTQPSTTQNGSPPQGGMVGAPGAAGPVGPPGQAAA